jgi:hypothetical protein
MRKSFVILCEFVMMNEKLKSRKKAIVYVTGVRDEDGGGDILAAKVGSQ